MKKMSESVERIEAGVKVKRKQMLKNMSFIEKSTTLISNHFLSDFVDKSSV